VTDDPNHRSHPRVAAGALIFDDAGQVMLVQPIYKDGWDIPGGYVEAGETPREACFRELREELGLDVELGELLVVDWAPHPAEGDKLLLVFDGGVLGLEQLASIDLQPDELSAYTCRDPAEAMGLLVPRLARRVGAAVQARLCGQTWYLEHGRRHGSPPANRPLPA
jgi:8-oxo-dGTP diphosphatase